MSDEIKNAVKEATEAEDIEDQEEVEVSEPTHEEQIEELENDLKRLSAEFDNYRKRTEAEKKETALYYKKEIIAKLLPVIDMFELALKHTENKEEFIKGMEMIYAQLTATLENEGLEVIDTKTDFDPHVHEAVITEESEEKEGSILEELQKGYTLNNKVIRYARVKVAKNEQKGSARKGQD